MRQHQLYAKISKCKFASTKATYLGHIISEEGVAVDPSKVEGMLSWPAPTTVKGLRGFLGLTGYYRKFVKGYGHIAKPLTKLLQKNSFEWSEEANKAFETLKKAMTITPVLTLPEFTKEFTIEADASDTGIGAVLIQEGKPVAFSAKHWDPEVKLCQSMRRI